MQDQNIAEYGISFGWADMPYLDFYIFANLFGIAKPISDEGMPQFDNPKGIAALQYMQDLVEKYRIASSASYSSGDHEVMTSFLGGKTPFQLQWPFVAAMLEDPSQSSVVGQARIGLIPGIGSMKSSSYIGTMGISATSGSKNKELAIKYVLFSGRKDMHKQMILVSKEVPILKSLVADKEIQNSNPLMLMMAEQFKYSINPPMFPWWPEVAPKFNTSLNKALSGMVSIEDGIAEAAQVLREAAEKHK
jgi:multiple sugar transport system substrate-binding protein